MLTPEQIAHVQSGFSADEIAEMTAAAEDLWSEKLGRPPAQTLKH
jgi:ATP-dependent DNA ligase